MPYEGKYLHHLKMPFCILNFQTKTSYTAISINVVGLKLQAFESRPNGGMGIHWNLHISTQAYQPLFVRSQHAPYQYSNFLANPHLQSVNRLLQNHIGQCSECPISCPNNCGGSFTREMVSLSFCTSRCLPLWH